MHPNQSTSGAAICQQGKSGRRYSDQERVLDLFSKYPERTCRELAMIVLLQRHKGKSVTDLVIKDVQDETTKIQRRVDDLVKPGRAEVEVAVSRKCRVSQNKSHAYRVTPKGVERLRKIGAPV